MGAEAGEAALGAGNLTQQYMPGLLKSAWAWHDDEGAPEPQLSPAEAKAQYSGDRPGLTFDAPITQDDAELKADDYDAQTRRSSILSRAQLSTPAWLVSKAVGMGTSLLTDPTADAAFSLPVFGEEAMAGRVAQMSGVGRVAGSAGIGVVRQAQAAALLTGADTGIKEYKGASFDGDSVADEFKDYFEQGLAFEVGGAALHGVSKAWKFFKGVSPDTQSSLIHAEVANQMGGNIDPNDVVGLDKNVAELEAQGAEPLSADAQKIQKSDFDFSDPEVRELYAKLSWKEKAWADSGAVELAHKNLFDATAELGKELPDDERAEMEGLHEKVQDGSASPEEDSRYQELQDKVSTNRETPPVETPEGQAALAPLRERVRQAVAERTARQSYDGSDKALYSPILAKMKAAKADYDFVGPTLPQRADLLTGPRSAYTATELRSMGRFDDANRVEKMGQQLLLQRLGKITQKASSAESKQATRPAAPEVPPSIKDGTSEAMQKHVDALTKDEKQGLEDLKDANNYPNEEGKEATEDPVLDHGLEKAEQEITRNKAKQSPMIEAVKCFFNNY